MGELNIPSSIHFQWHIYDYIQRSQVWHPVVFYTFPLLILTLTLNIIRWGEWVVDRERNSLQNVMQLVSKIADSNPIPSGSTVPTVFSRCYTPDTPPFIKWPSTLLGDPAYFVSDRLTQNSGCSPSETDPSPTPRCLSGKPSFLDRITKDQSWRVKPTGKRAPIFPAWLSHTSQFMFF